MQQFISLESYFEINHRVSKLLSVEVFDNMSKLQSDITIKWPAGNLSSLLGEPRVCINSSFFGYFDGLERSTF